MARCNSLIGDHIAWAEMTGLEYLRRTPQTLQVQEDIVTSLKLDNPLRLISSFNRPNITYEVAYQLEGRPSLVKQLSKLIRGMAGPDDATPCCIVYTLKRETADEYAQKLRMQGRTLLEG